MITGGDLDCISSLSKFEKYEMTRRPFSIFIHVSGDVNKQEIILFTARGDPRCVCRENAQNRR